MDRFLEVLNKFEFFVGNPAQTEPLTKQKASCPQGIATTAKKFWLDFASFRTEGMSGINASPMAIFTIEVGTPGTFTNDGALNIVPALNAEIEAAPKGDQIDIIFNPGVYGEGGSTKDVPILLPSNTSVIGNDATLQFIAPHGQMGNMMMNADSYWTSAGTVVNNTNGTSIIVPSNPSSTEAIFQSDTLGTPIRDSNISIEGMTFNDVNGSFANCFVDATNVDVQNNTYIGGVDSVALVNVKNAVVADNISIGARNAAYDSWNGPVDITIEDNIAFTGKATNTGWAVLFNATPTGDPTNPGSAINDAIVGNLFSSNYNDSSASNADPLRSYGYAAESRITQQGNIDSVLNSTNPQGYYEANVTNTVVEDNLLSQPVGTSGSNDGVLAVLSQSSTDPQLQTSNANVTGNLILGAVNDGSTSLIENSGVNPTTVNNASLDQNNYESYAISTAGFTEQQTVSGNIINSGSTTTGFGVVVSFGIVAPPNLFVTANSPTSVPELMIDDPNSSDVISVTLSAQFGMISFSSDVTGVIYQEANGVPQITLTGNLAEINSDLSETTYIGNASGWDDSIEVNSTDSSGLSATRYIPVIVQNPTLDNSSNISVVPPGLISPTAEASEFPGQTLPTMPALNGNIIVASAGDNLILMGTTASMAMLGSGDNTVVGGSLPEYITAGSGNSTISLAQSGDVTVAGGSGSLVVNADTGNNLIETGSSTATITAGIGSNTVAAGLGDITVNGGSGPLYLATLPQDGGQVDINLGTGNSTIYALSGNDTITTQKNSSNTIYTGIGDVSINANGNDLIYTGAGSDTVNIADGTSATIIGGIGSLTFIGGTNSDLYVPNYENSLISVSGFSNIFYGTSTVLTTNVENLEIAGNSNSSSLYFINDSSQISTIAGGLDVNTSSGAPTSGASSVGITGLPLGGLTNIMMADTSMSEQNNQTNSSGVDRVVTEANGNEMYFVGNSTSEHIAGSTVSGAVTSYIFGESSETSNLNDTIMNFNCGTDKVYINPFSTYNNIIISGIASNGNGSIISLSNGTSIELFGVSSSLLNSSILGGTIF